MPGKPSNLPTPATSSNGRPDSGINTHRPNTRVHQSTGVFARARTPPSGPGAPLRWRPHPWPARTTGSTFGDVLRSEWTKLRSVRSAFWALTVTVVLGVGLGAVISAAAAHGYARSSVSQKLSWDPTGVSLDGLAVASPAIAVLGVLCVSSDGSPERCPARSTTRRPSGCGASWPSWRTPASSAHP